MAKEECEEHIGFEVRLIQNLIDEEMKKDLEKEGIQLKITQLQQWIIRYLDEHRDSDVYQRDLETELCTSRATISNTLQAMERCGLVTRTAVKEDARLKKLNLTDKGLALGRHAQIRIDEMERLMIKGMTDEEAGEVKRLLRQIRRNLEEETEMNDD